MYLHILFFRLYTVVIEKVNESLTALLMETLLAVPSPFHHIPSVITEIN
mgnify:CR=1 FL=1